MDWFADLNCTAQLLWMVQRLLAKSLNLNPFRSETQRTDFVVSPSFMGIWQHFALPPIWLVCSNLSASGVHWCPVTYSAVWGLVIQRDDNGGRKYMEVRCLAFAVPVRRCLQLSLQTRLWPVFLTRSGSRMGSRLRAEVGRSAGTEGRSSRLGQRPRLHDGVAWSCTSWADG